MNSPWTNVGRLVRPLASEFGDLKLGPPVRRWAEAGTHVDAAAAERGQVTLRGDDVQQRARRLEVYQRVEVARAVGRLAGDRAELTQAARTVATRDGEDVSPPRAGAHRAS